MWHRLGFMDHLCAMGSLISTLLALYHRDRTGETQFVAGSLLAGGVMTGSETYLDAERRDRCRSRCSTTSRPASRPATASLTVADGWVAVAATTDEQLAALCTVAGVDRVEDAAAALGTRAGAEALAALADAGVPCEAGAARPGRAVLRLARQRRRRADRARTEHVDYGARRAARRVLDLRRPRRQASTARRRDWASTRSRCSPRSVSTPPPSTRCSPSGAAHAVEGSDPHDDDHRSRRDKGRCRPPASPMPVTQFFWDGVADGELLHPALPELRALPPLPEDAVPVLPVRRPRRRAGLGPRHALHAGRSRCSRSTRSTSTASRTSWRRSSSSRSPGSCS